MKEITLELKEFLLNQGADLVGFADISALKDAGYPFGISVGIKIPQEIVKGIYDGPTAEYYQAYTNINSSLNEIVRKGAAFLQSKGFKAQAQTTDSVVTQSDNRTTLPHKTIALRAGLGWIGKNNLLITRQYGGAVRLSAILTDAPLTPAAQLHHSLCGDCAVCFTVCPAHSIKGNNWEAGMDRDDMIDMRACEAMANQLSGRNFGKPDATICGLCFAMCPFTQRYLNEDKREQ